mmetsp:Transcript_845/g.2261  ORF Transcript_845/g.2261 Transcript_845/m.2261 type:complete len:86 (-) Transcript_845:29-286(-)
MLNWAGRGPVAPSFEMQPLRQEGQQDAEAGPTYSNVDDANPGRGRCCVCRSWKTYEKALWFSLYCLLPMAFLASVKFNPNPNPKP